MRRQRGGSCEGCGAEGGVHPTYNKAFWHAVGCVKVGVLISRAGQRMGGVEKGAE